MSQKKFAVFDIDGTFFRWQLFSEIVFELIDQGHIPKNTRKRIDAKMDEWRSRKSRHSFHDYELVVVDVMLSHLNTVKVKDLEAAADTILNRAGLHVYAYTRNLADTLRKQGYVLIAISGSQEEIVQRFAKLWHFDIALGQTHDTKGEYYTGAIPSPLLIQKKGKILQQIVLEHNLTYTGSYAIGDSRSDAAMLKLVENPIAFNPDDALFPIAREKGWKIVIERKNMMYELEQKDGTYILAQAKPR